MPSAVTLEVCVDNFESMLVAESVGVPRLEVCSALADGGLTPSRALLEQFARRRDPAKATALYVMIRPRGGDFCYSPDEVDIMQAEIEAFKTAPGVSGFVFGCLTADGDIDLDANRRLLAAASPFGCTFHRAFDMLRCPRQSLSTLIELGFERVLTSGCQSSAEAGVDLIAELVVLAGGRISIMPGAGVTPDNAEMIIRKTGAREIHSSASVVKRSPLNSDLRLGANAVSGSDYKVCCPVKAGALMDIVRRL